MTAAAPPTRTSRAPLIFVIISIVVALAAGGYYYYRLRQDAKAMPPEETVVVFLQAVFTADDATRLTGVVCSSWDPAQALERTVKAVPDAARVSWDNVRVLSSDSEKASVQARLGYRLPDDKQPSAYAQWSFALVRESGWRVCDARPLVI